MAQGGKVIGRIGGVVMSESRLGSLSDENACRLAKPTFFFLFLFLVFLSSFDLKLNLAPPTSPPPPSAPISSHPPFWVQTGKERKKEEEEEEKKKKNFFFFSFSLKRDYQQTFKELCLRVGRRRREGGRRWGFDEVTVNLFIFFFRKVLKPFGKSEKERHS